MMTFSKTALIIGCGPAGLTAAYELLQKTDIKPIIIETSDVVGGISATYNHNGNRIDIGGHRFYTKNNEIERWWRAILPFQSAPAIDDLLLKRDLSEYYDPHGVDPQKDDNVMLVRPRLSRIFFRRHLFDYPLKASLDTFRKLGINLTTKIAWDYLVNRIKPIHPEKNLEDFFINRFGKQLYEVFFKDYTEKVWGVPCDQLSKEWGSQRIKGVSIFEVFRHLVFGKMHTRKQIQTSLIPHFYYPKLGPGQMWEVVASRIEAMGGEIHLNATVTSIVRENTTVQTVGVSRNSGYEEYSPDIVLSSMPIKDLFRIMVPEPPEKLVDISENLRYRDFIMVGVLVKSMQQGYIGPVYPETRLLPDTWIYIQEQDIIAGRLQIYNNWSPYMVEDHSTVWMGLEFFCNEGDRLWAKPDNELIKLATAELEKMDLVTNANIVDGTCIRIKKAYPSYFGGYRQFDKIKDFLVGFDNLYCIGRNGQHRYNNMDHSMLTAIAAVYSIKSESANKKEVWNVNTDESYGEKEKNY